MIEALQQFGNLSVAQRTGDVPVELVRSKDEVVFLAFDNRIHRLVELHVISGGGTLAEAMKRSAFERAREAAEIRGHAFMRILEVGEDHGMVYYTSNLNDGEFVEDYTQRRGPVAPATALALVYQLLEDLLRLQGAQHLVSRMRLDRVLVTALEDTFLQLRVFDYGLSELDAGDAEQGNARLVVEVCRLVFLLLTGQSHAGENPDRFPVLTQLPMSLRTAVRTALTDPANAPASIEKLRDDVREAFSALSGNIKARNFRKHLVVNAALLPQSHLQELLLEHVPVEAILGTRFRVEDADHTRYPFSIPAINTKLNQAITVHLLPPSRIVDKSRYEAVPLQMWRFNPERHPNILRSLSLWESPDWSFLTEEREPGLALSRLMTERVTLNSTEVMVLMHQIRAGLDQAVECGVQRVDLHPSNILLRVGKNGPLQAREFERLMQKRLDAWPTFVVKLRPHVTMRSLYEPLLVGMDTPTGEPQEEHLQNRDFRHRSFVALAGYLLTGELQSGGMVLLAESIPEAAAAYVRECLDLTRLVGRTPSPGDFLDKFEGLLSAPTVDLATRLRGSSTVAIEEMESAGSVSDFDDEWKTPEAGDGDHAAEVISPIRRGIKPHEFNALREPVCEPSYGLPWGALAAAAAVVLGLGAWIVLGGQPAPAITAQPAVSSATTAALTVPKPVATIMPAPPPVVTAATPPPAPAVSALSTVPEAGPPHVPANARQIVAPHPSFQASLPPPQVTSAQPDPKLTAESVTATAVETVPETAAETADAAATIAPPPPPAAISSKPAAAPDHSAASAAPLPTEAITIRRAILPSKAEIARMKRQQMSDRTDQLPALSTASPLPKQGQ